MSPSLRNRFPATGVTAAPGEATATVKAAFATGDVRGRNIRNRLPGSVASVTTGPAMAGVSAAIEALTAAITGDAVDGLGIAAGTPAGAPVASTEVALATA
jgi:molybdopterin-binding protein